MESFTAQGMVLQNKVCMFGGTMACLLNALLCLFSVSENVAPGRETHILLTASSHKLRSRLIAKWSSARGGITLSTWQREARTRSPGPQ